LRRGFGGSVGLLRHGRRGRGRANVIRAFAIAQQHGDGAVDLHPLGSFGHQDFADRPFVDGLEFHGRLVGFDLGQKVAGMDRIPFLDQPFGERAVLHRGGQGGHQDFDGHVGSPSRARGARGAFSRAMGVNGAAGRAPRAGAAIAPSTPTVARQAAAVSSLPSTRILPSA